MGIDDRKPSPQSWRSHRLLRQRPLRLVPPHHGSFYPLQASHTRSPLPRLASASLSFFLSLHSRASPDVESFRPAYTPHLLSSLFFFFNRPLSQNKKIKGCLGFLLYHTDSFSSKTASNAAESHAKADKQRCELLARAGSELRFAQLAEACLQGGKNISPLWQLYLFT